MMERAYARLTAAFLAVLLLVTAGPLVAAGPLGAASPLVAAVAEPSLPRDTVMIYMIGSNLEADFGLASADIQEMLDAGVDQAHTNVLIYMNGAPNWMRGMDMNKNHLFQLDGGQLKHLEEYTGLDMCSPETLSAFLNYGRQHFPAERYALVLWDHGRGPIAGFGVDTRYDDKSMSLPCLRQALEASPFGEEERLEWIAFDACLMATAETAYTVRDYARFLVASQEAVQNNGLDYSFLAQLPTLADGAAIGRAMVASYGQYYEQQFNKAMLAQFLPALTLSCIELAQLAPLETALDALFARLGHGMALGNFSSLVRLRDQQRSFGKASMGSNYDLIDMAALAKDLESFYPEETRALLAAIEQLVICNDANIDSACGLSLYYPHSSLAFFETQAFQIYQEIGFSAGYQQFLEGYAKRLAAGQPVAWEAASLTPELVTRQNVTLQLTPQQQAAFASAYFLVLEHLGEVNGYGFVRLMRNVTLDEAGLLSVPYEHSTLFFVDQQTGEKGPIYIIEQESGDGYIKAVAQGIGYRQPAEEDGWWEMPEVMSVEMQLGLDRNSNQNFILQVLRTDKATFNAGKNQLALQELFAFDMMTGTRLPSYDRQGNLLPFFQWEKGPISYGNSIRLSNAIQLVMDSYDQLDGALMGMFVVRDVQGNEYASGLVPLKAAKTQTEADAPPKTEVDIPAASLTGGNTLLLENDLVAVHLSDLKLTCGYEWELCLELDVTNLRQTGDVNFGASRLYLNDQVVNLSFPLSAYHIAPGQTQRVTEKIKMRYLPLFSVKDAVIETMDLFLTVSDSDSYQELKREQLVLHTQLDLSAAFRYLPFRPTCNVFVEPQVIIDEAGILARITGIEWERGDYQMVLEIENNSAATCSFSLVDTYVNDQMDALFFSATVHPGKAGRFAVLLSETDAFDMGESELRDFGFRMKVDNVLASGFEPMLCSALIEAECLPAEGWLESASALPPLLDEEGIRIIPLGIYQSSNNHGGEMGSPCLKLLILNNSARDMALEIYDGQINGIDAGLRLFPQGVLAGKRLLATVDIPVELVLKPQDPALHSLTFSLRAYDQETRERILATEPMTLEHK